MVLAPGSALFSGWFEGSFFSDGSLYIWDSLSPTMDQIFHRVDLHASFCEWSPSGNALVFSAYPIGGQTHPPDIYTIGLDTKTLVQLTDTEYVDRFLQWSPSSTYIVFRRQSLTEAERPIHIQVINTRTGASGDGSPYPHASGVHFWTPVLGAPFR